MADPPTAISADAHVIARDNDLSTVEAVAGHRRTRPDEPVVALFEEPELAGLYADDRQVTALAWLPSFARRVAAAMPPGPRLTIAPPPVVIGDGRVARYLVVALVEGWAEPGQPLDVHCLGDDPAWAQEAEVVVEPRGRLTWSETTVRPIPVVRRVTELTDAWKPPAQKRGSPTGPTVLLALDDPVASMSIAAGLVGSVKDVRVGVVVPDAAPWPSAAGITVFSTDDARRDAVGNHRAPLTVLVEQLLSDVAWLAAPDAQVTCPVAPIFAEAAYAPTGEPQVPDAPGPAAVGRGEALPLDEQPAVLRVQLTAIAAALPVIAAAGALGAADPARRVEPVILTPDELRCMASEILRVLEVAEEPGTRQTAIELAFLLPGIASRAGQPLRRPSGYEQLLTFDEVERLSPLVHLAYQDISAQTNNATDSPLAGALWNQLTEFDRASNRAVLVGAAVTHAVVGLDWRASGKPTIYTLDAEQTEWLAELEHRRWAIHQRRNGSTDHGWMKPWTGPEGQCVSEGAKEYDRHIVRQVLHILAGTHIEVHSA